MDSTEKIILAKFNKYKIIRKRDVFQLPKGKDVSFFTKSYDYLSNYFEDIEDNIELEEPSEEEQNIENEEKKKSNLNIIKHIVKNIMTKFLIEKKIFVKRIKNISKK